MTFREEGNIILKKIVFWQYLNVLNTFDCPCHFRLPKFNILCNMLKISAGDTWVVHPLGPKWQLCCSVGARGSSEPVQSELQSAHTQQVSSSSIDIKQLRHRLRLSLLVLTLVPCPALLSSWLVPPWWTQVCKTFGSSWIPAFSQWFI